MDDYDEYAPRDDGTGASSDGSYFDAEPEAPQDGPDLFGAGPEAIPAKAVAAQARRSHDDEPQQRQTEKADPEPSPSAGPDRLDAPPLALYRRYRPDTFAEVIGQEHVTEPLQRTLANNRVNHAYLFSGPRGCGKTSSARILARCLNCAEGPTPTPCGECQSCRDLARNGPGSIDVIEIDAASHGGVDDARDLRERAFFAPVRSRYKIYIVDEAHMVTTAGFNALLKLVEEPPPHVKFIFATTAPEKVIGTIRSRTHHYPFRLVPPRILTDYLGTLCEAEGVAVDPAVLPLVVRAGAGSVRDSLSVLDQLLGAADAEGIKYAQAAALLGYTPDALLDEIVDGFAAGDAAAVFATVDKIIEIGQDPRRFAEDLLRRLRDLVIVAAVPDAAAIGLIDVPADQAQRFATQVKGMGQGELTRAAEVLASGLTEMRGTTAPRLHLELMCARVLLPGSDVAERGLHARIDRLERRVGMMGDPKPAPQWNDPAPQPAQVPERTKAPEKPRVPDKKEPGPDTRRRAKAPAAPDASAPRPLRPVPEPVADEPPAPAQKGRPGSLTTVELRGIWPAILQRMKERRRYTWMVVSQNAQVSDLSDGKLTLGFSNPGARDSFSQRGGVEDLKQVLIDEIGVELRIVATLAGETKEEAPRQRPANVPPRSRPAETPAPTPAPEPEPQISDDDEELVDESLSAAELLASELGAEIIHEEPAD